MGEQKYISLKEAAKISGYAPDYVGQLIRNGKIPGKQVYCNTAWVTTEEAVQIYKEEDKKREKAPSLERKIRERVRKVRIEMDSETKMAGFLKIALFGITIISVCTSLVLVFFLLVSIERRFENQKLETESQIPQQASILENIEL
ncbi:hypothetical protein CL635_03305 [bacterium]|nr:hypothetical protein [bacterium]|tara:strand:- start:899 stop:1333 length:435 start_codon:yes stop_codon:yes gene_type:complete